MNRLESFKIRKLHGYKNYNLKFKNNTLILVGENGAGKTTILKMLYYVISKQWNSLSKIIFDSVTVKVDGRTFTINRNEIRRKIDFSDRKFLRKLPPSIRNRFLRLVENHNIYGNSISELHMLCDRYNIPFKFVIDEIEPNFDLFENDENIDKFKEKEQLLAKAFNDTQVLYLPTYRRIEEELNTIFKDFDEDIRSKNQFYKKKNIKRHLEIIEFGMRDVDSAISNTLEALKDFARESLNTLTLGYLGDVVDQKYTNLDISQIKNASEEIIGAILDRIDSQILSDKSKKHLSGTIENIKKGKEPDVHAKVICHYFIKLLNFQQELNIKEHRIQKFCEVCNSYMEDKFFQYISSSFDFSILPKNESVKKVNEIKTDQLSSGEKQIVSLFSHLFLSNNRNYFVLIDEPELSLSVPWQRQFLVDIRNGEFCSGLVAVTHSPFIYDNELDAYAHGLGEF